MNKISSTLLLAFVALAAHHAAFANAYPVRPIRFIVPYPPGGGADTLARTVGQKIGDAWGQQVVIDNRPGGATNIAAEAAANAAPDGYTLLETVLAHAVNASLFPKLGYDLQRDFAPVIFMATIPNILVVHPSVPVKSTRELIDYARTRPGALNYASTGNGGPQHLGMELFKTLTGVQLTHVPYKGAAPAMNAVLAGEVSMFCGPITQGLAHVKGGKLKAIGVTGSSSSALVPELPTLSTTIPGLVVSSTYMLYAPPATPANIAQLIKADLRKTWEDKDVRERLGAMGMDLIWLEGAELTRRVDADLAKWSNVVKTAGIRAD